MRQWTTALALVLAAPLAAQTAAPTPGAAPASAPIVASGAAPLEGGSTFISPMGEPFRSTDTLSGAEHWFAQADANHDGRLSPDEMRADADRFFATLDTDHDGEIGPDELTRYESDVAPEIRVASTMGNMALGKTDDDGNYTPPPYPTRLGAGRYGYLDMPEPVISADTNMDRAVSKQEFEMAALRRFKMLDVNGDGALTRDELPKLSSKSPKDEAGSGPGGGHRHHGGHRGGGGQGGLGGF